MDVKNGKLVELLTERGNYDTRKVTNRSDAVIPQSVLDAIEADGVTSEYLDELDVPVFKYKTQVTIHGHFPALASGYVGRYKSLIRNGNESVGVRYAAMDYAKKKRIYSAMEHCGWTIVHNSQEWKAYKMSGVGKSRAELADAIAAFKTQEAAIDASLFYGDTHVGLYQSPYFGIFALISVEVGAIYEANVDALIENICQRPVGEIACELAEKKAREDAERAAWDAKYDAEQRERKERLNTQVAEIKPRLAERGLEFHDDLPLAERRYLRLSAGYENVEYAVREVFKHAGKWRVVTKTFGELDDALECLRCGTIAHRDSKEITKCAGWTLANLGGV